MACTNFSKSGWYEACNEEDLWWCTNCTWWRNYWGQSQSDPKRDHDSFWR